MIRINGTIDGVNRLKNGQVKVVLIASPEDKLKALQIDGNVSVTDEEYGLPQPENHELAANIQFMMGNIEAQIADLKDAVVKLVTCHVDK